MKDNANSLLLVKHTSSLKFSRNISFVPHELCNISEFTIILCELISSARHWSWICVLHNFEVSNERTVKYRLILFFSSPDSNKEHRARLGFFKFRTREMNRTERWSPCFLFCFMKRQERGLLQDKTGMKKLPFSHLLSKLLSCGHKKLKCCIFMK